jgi:NAD dependent epimerase/dehydratase family enzyme
MVVWMIGNGAASGAFNATAPMPVTNHIFTRTLGRVLGRPAILKAPAFAMRLAAGEMADMVLHGQRVMPVHAEQLGFQFTHRALEPALMSLHL